MDSKKRISISLRNLDEKKENQSWIAKEEQAAASEPDKKWNQIEFEGSKETKIYSMPLKNKSRPFFKNILLTVLTALVISFALGFILLRMFVTLTDDSAKVTENSLAPATTEVTAGGLSDDLTLDSFVIQAGVFSTEDKAEEWKIKLSAQSISSVIWERDRMYYLFTGSAQTESEAQALADDLTESGIETYIKPWTVNVQTSSLGTEEAEAVQQLKPYMTESSLNTLEEKSRQTIVGKLEAGGDSQPLIMALQNITPGDERNLNWIKVGLGLEKIGKQ